MSENEGWRDIATAPIDTPVLVFGYWEGEIYHTPDDEPGIYIAKGYGKNGVVSGWSIIGGEYYSTYCRRPTHWMPLPAPPLPAAEAGEG